MRSGEPAQRVVLAAGIDRSTAGFEWAGVRLTSFVLCVVYCVWQAYRRLWQSKVETVFDFTELKPTAPPAALVRGVRGCFDAFCEARRAIG